MGKKFNRLVADSIAVFILSVIILLLIVILNVNRFFILVPVVLIILNCVFFIHTLSKVYTGIQYTLDEFRKGLSAIEENKFTYDFQMDKKNDFLQLEEIYVLIKNKLNSMSEEQRKMDDMTRKMIGNITHDLRTPLTAIMGYAQGVLEGVAGTPERLNKYMVTVCNKAGYMNGLIDELAYFSLIYQEDIEYSMSKVNANEYFSSCVSALSLDLELKKIILLYRYIGDTSIELLLDREKVKRVINNIIGNASKYMNNDMGLIYTYIIDKEEQIVVHIMDNGPGIDKSKLPNIFDRFFRADNSRNSKTGGSGLGLSIAKKIIEDHKGRIWAESKEGEGTKISFFIPKVSAEKLKAFDNIDKNGGERNEESTNY